MFNWNPEVTALVYAGAILVSLAVASFAAYLDGFKRGKRVGREETEKEAIASNHGTYKFDSEKDGKLVFDWKIKPNA